MAYCNLKNFRVCRSMAEEEVEMSVTPTRLPPERMERRKNRWPPPEQAPRRIVRNGPVSFRSKTQPEEHGPASWDQFPIYGLEKAALEIFLIQTFGGRHSFMITVSISRFHDWWNC